MKQLLCNRFGLCCEQSIVIVCNVTHRRYIRSKYIMEFGTSHMSDSPMYQGFLQRRTVAAALPLDGYVSAYCSFFYLIALHSIYSTYMKHNFVVILVFTCYGKRYH